MGGGSIEALKHFLNTKTEPDFVLAVTSILQALRGKGPFAVEALRRGQCAAVEIVGVFVAAGDGEDVRAAVRRAIRARITSEFWPTTAEPLV